MVMWHIAIPSCNFPHEIARVSHDMSACFGYEKNELLIYKKDGIVMARLDKNGKAITVQISQAQLDYFKAFVEELKKFKADGLCTTFERYRVVMNGDIIYREDGSCHWHGFNKLSKQLFDRSLSELTQP